MLHQFLHSPFSPIPLQGNADLSDVAPSALSSTPRQGFRRTIRTWSWTSAWWFCERPNSQSQCQKHPSPLYICTELFLYKATLQLATAKAPPALFTKRKENRDAEIFCLIASPCCSDLPYPAHVEGSGVAWSFKRYCLSVQDEHLQLAAHTGFIRLQLPGEPTVRIAPAVLIKLKPAV